MANNNENALARLARDSMDIKDVFGTGAGSKAAASTRYKDYVRQAQENGEDYVSFEEYVKAGG